MRLSTESRGVRWTALIGVWAVVAVLLSLHAVAVRDHLAEVDQRGLRGQAATNTPFEMPYLPGAVDAQEWVQHALLLIDGHQVQLRHTDIDNAPFGRDVHWNSAWAWTIAGAGWLDHKITGQPLTTSLERMTIWLNPFVLFVLTVCVSWYAARRAGAIIGVIVAIAMVGHNNFYDGFQPNYVDHHGLLSASVLGMMLCAVFMGAGWWHENGGPTGLLSRTAEAARSAAVASALCGALGLWVSAASVIPPIAFVGLAGLATTLIAGRTAVRAGMHYDASLWRLWGRVGAAASVFFYMVEYFPSHFGLRLEANHPLYALAWWGAGEFIAEFSERWLAAGGMQWRQPGRLLGPLALVLIPPTVIVLGGAKVFTPLDPFLAHFYNTYLLEFKPLWDSLDGLSWNPYYSIVGIENLPLVFAIGVIVAKRGRVPPSVWFATLATLAFTAMAWVQQRWLSNAAGPQICLALVLVTFLAASRPLKVRWAAAVGGFCVLFLPTAVYRITDTRAEVADNEVAPNEQLFMLYRDAAGALRAAQPTGNITLLASPNASLTMGYYGQFKTLGTGFWENDSGLKAAAEIYSAPDADSAAVLMRERDVTDVALIPEDEFVLSYYHLLHPEASEADFEHTFGYHLLYEHQVPSWLQAIPYSVPDDLRALGLHVLLYKVAFEQTAADAMYHSALEAMALGDAAVAERELDSLIRADPKSHQAWLAKGRLLAAEQRWVPAVDAALTGIRLSPLPEHLDAYRWLAGVVLGAQVPALQVRVLRAELAEMFQPDVACLLASVLATSKDDAVRSGPEAVALARRALQTQPNSPTYLNCLSAGLAETGRFAEAVAAASQALAAAEAQNDGATARISEALIASFKAGKPWRE